MHFLFFSVNRALFERYIFFKATSSDQTEYLNKIFPELPLKTIKSNN